MTQVLAGAIALVLTTINDAATIEPIAPGGQKNTADSLVRATAGPNPLLHFPDLAHMDRQWEAVARERWGWREPEPPPVATAAAIAPVRPIIVMPREEIVSIIASYPWPLDSALRIVTCESKGDPNAYNRTSGATGLFQILPYWHSWRVQPGASLWDPAENVRVAYQLWSEQSWQPWIVGGCYP